MQIENNDAVAEDQNTVIETEVDQNIEDQNMVVDEQQEGNTEGAAGEAGTAEGVTEPEGEDELVISMGDEVITQEDEEQKQAPPWVKELRKASREKDKRIRELEAKLNTGATAASPVKLPPKPKLEDFDYDPDQFEEKLSGWYEQKRQFDAQEEAARQAQEQIQREWDEKLEKYNKAKTELKVADYEDAEAYIQGKFNVTQQGIILQGLENPALVVYALGKNQKKAEELAKIADPVRFAVAVGKLETQLKVTTRKAPPPPPKTVAGTAPVSGSVDSHLERLRADAERTGDYSKVLQYKAQKRK